MKKGFPDKVPVQKGVDKKGRLVFDFWSLGIGMHVVISLEAIE